MKDALDSRKKKYTLVGGDFIMKEILKRVDPDLDETNINHIIGAYTYTIREMMKNLEEFSDGFSGHYRLTKKGRKKFIEKIEKNFNFKLECKK